MQRRAQLAQGVGRDQRIIGIDDQDIARTAGEGVACREHRMSGAKRRILQRRLPRGHELGHRVLTFRQHHDAALGLELRNCIQDVSDYRFVGEGVQHFRQERLHPSAFPGSKHHDGER